MTPAELRRAAKLLRHYANRLKELPYAHDKDVQKSIAEYGDLAAKLEALAKQGETG